jgi:DNA-binding response OmpR family regulator
MSGIPATASHDEAGQDTSQRETLRIGDVEIRIGEGLVLAAGRPLTFSVREFRKLVALVSRAGGIVSRDELYRAVWGRELRSGDRSVDVYVSKVRGKLGQALPNQRFIHTHPGFGYRFEAPLLQNLDNSKTGARNTAAAGGQ